MAAWDVVEVDFGGDETGNFGPRLESGSALYQVETAATISPRENVAAFPHVCSAAVEENVCVTAGNYLSVFNDSGRTFVITLAFDSVIDCITWSENGSFLVLGERSGKLHFLDCQARDPFFSTTISENVKEGECTFKNIYFTPTSTDGVCSLVVLTADTLFLFSNIHILHLQDAIYSGDFSLAKTWQSQMKTNILETGGIHLNGTVGVVILSLGVGRDTIITAGSGKAVLCVWENVQDGYKPVRKLVSTVFQNNDVAKIRSTSNGRYLLILSSKAELSLWDTCSLTQIRKWPHEAIIDFCLLDSDDNKNNFDNMKVVLLSRLGASCQLHICTFPKLDCVYKLQLSSNTVLAACPTIQEALFLIEAIADEDGDPACGLTSTLHLRCLSEAQPETRFYRILHKKHFDEAETFAKLYNLDVELVYKVRVNWILDCLAPWSTTNLDDDRVDESLQKLKTCLVWIQDDTFVVDACIKATPPSFEATLELLNYARSRLKDDLEVENGQGEEKIFQQELMTKVLVTLHRLATYQTAFGIQQFSAADWDYFQKANIVEEFLKYVQMGKTSTAFTIYRRHQREFDKDFSCDLIEDILISMPEETPSDELKPWLAEDFIPYVIRVLPKGLAFIAKWLQQRARNMEIMEKTGWPSNAIQMCESLQTTYLSVSQSTSQRRLATPHHFCTQICNLSVGYSQIKDSENGGDADDPFVHLHKLITQLKDLQSLHTKYSCNLSLAEYVQESTESLTYRMLDRVVAAELLPVTLDKVIRPYMKEHGLNEDKMLFQYIGDLVGRSGMKFSCLGEAAWETKAIAVIRCIQDPEYKCRAILDAMIRAYVPWSADMEALVKDGLALNHNRVEEIREKCRLIELRKMLTRYDMRNYNVNESARAEKLMYFILNLDRPTVVEDALEVVKAYNNLNVEMLYIFRTRFLVENNRIEECLELLRSLPEETSSECCRRLIIDANIRLETPSLFNEKEDKKKKMLFTKVACEVIPFLVTLESIDYFEKKAYTMMLKMLKNMYALQVQFDEFIHPKQYEDIEFKKKILIKHMSIIYRQKSEEKNATATKLKESAVDRRHGKENTYTKMYRLAELLDMNRDTLRGDFAIIAAKNGDISRALKMVHDLLEYSTTPDIAEIVYRVVLALCDIRAQEKFVKECDAIKDLAAILHQFACQAITICSPELLPDLLELCKCMDQAKRVLQQCERGDYGVSVRGTSKQGQITTNVDPYKEWTFDSLFKEDGLVMDSAVIMPLIYKYTMTCLPNHENRKKLPYCQSRIQAIPHKAEDFLAVNLSKVALAIVQQLSENSQQQLALQYTLDTLSASVQHLGIQNFNVKVDPKVGQEMLQQIVNTCLSTSKQQICALLEKLFSQRYVDHGLALGCILSLPQSTAWEKLKKIREKCGQRYRRILAVAKVGIDYAEVQQQPKYLRKYKEIETNSHWGHRFAKIKIPYKNVFSGEKSPGHLIPQIVQNEAVDVTLIQEYCSAFKFNLDEMMFLYFEHLLLQQWGDTTSASHINSQLYKADQVLADIKYDKTQLFNKLQAVLHKVNPYNYECIDFLLTRMEADSNQSTDLKLLEFLKMYKRTTTPSEYELNYNMVVDDEQLIFGSHNLSHLAKERLPYHPFVAGEPWKIITPELNANTVHTWLLVASILKLPEDQVLITTIRNIVEEHVLQKSCAGALKDGKGDQTVNKEQCNWDIREGVDHQFFDTVMRLLMRVSTCEMAIACASWIVKKLPMGAEKVMALKICVQLAQKWTEACEKKTPEQKTAIEAFRKFSVIAKRLSTEQVLFQYGLGEQSLLDLTTTPAKLILHLYEHDSILHQRFCSSTMEHLPDIHKVADEIAVINNVNINKIRITLVEKWLPSAFANQQDEADMSLALDMQDMDMSIRTEEETSEEEANLRRVIYILQNNSPESNSMFLLNYAYKSASSKITNMCRVRAFCCLFYLFDNQTIEKLAKKPIEEIRDYMQVLLYLVEFDHLHLPQTILNFIKCKKEGLVRGIWRNHSHQKRAVRLVADMCLDYKLFDVQLWNSIFQQLLAFQKTEYLRHVLICLSGTPHLWQVDCVQKMWRNVLTIPLNAGVAPLTESQLEDCLESANLLHRCPLLLDMDVLYFAKQFLRLELPVCALGCLLLVSKSDVREENISALWSQFPKEMVHQQMMLWKNQGKVIPLLEQIAMECSI